MSLHAIQPAFSKGELSPRLHAKVDHDLWRSGLALCRNMVVARQAILRKRPGTRFIRLAKAQGQNDKVRLVRFVFSAAQSYVLELSHLVMRIHALGGTVTVAGEPYEVATPWAGADLADLQFAQSRDVVYVTHRAYAPREIARISETNWTVSLSTFEDGPYMDVNGSGTTLRVGIPPPPGSADWTSGQIVPPTVTPAGASTVFTGALGGGATDYWTTTTRPGVISMDFGAGTPKRIVGYGLASDNRSSGSDAPRTWTFEASTDNTVWVTLDSQAGVTGWGNSEWRFFQFVNETAYRYYRFTVIADNTTDPVTGTARQLRIARLALQGGGADAPILTVEASSVAGINGGQGFLASDVGRPIRVFSEAAYWHWLEITERVSATQVLARLRSPPLPNVKATATWRLGAFSTTTGWPARVAFFQDRLVYARTDTEPQTLWMTKTGGYGAVEDFGTSVPLVDDDAITMRIGEAGAIQWIMEGDQLIVGTLSAVRAYGPSDRARGLSATNIDRGRPRRRPVEAIQPIDVGDTIMAVGRFGLALREVIFSAEAGGYVLPDTSILSEHLLRSGVTAIAYCHEPQALLWAATKDGLLVGLTFERDQQMAALHAHPMPGGAKVESIAAIPGTERDELWLSVWRPGIGRTIEQMAAEFDDASQAEAFFVDCGLTYRGAAVTTVTGLGHLNGQTVSILADGAPEAQAVVSGGQVSLASGQAASVIHVGLPYEAKARTLRQSGGSQDGSGLGRRKSIRAVIVDLLASGGFRAKAGASREETYPLRSAGDSMGLPPPLMTGARSITLSDRQENHGVLEIVSDDPTPLTIRALTPVFDGEP